METASRSTGPSAAQEHAPNIGHRDKGFRIDASPQEVAQAIMQGGARPRPETRRKKD